MSRTVRNKHYCWLRHPKGYKQSKINKVRPGARPPHSWDDIQISHEARSQQRRKDISP